MTASPSSPRIVPGTRIGGKLTLIRLLAEGGMGNVWLAQNRQTGAHVAVKLLREEAADDDIRRRFRYEARLGAVLNHRNIVRVYDMVEDGDTVALVMERLRGSTLETRCAARGPQKNREIVAAMVPILSALQHAHDNGVVHRDVKPSNVFFHVEPDGHVIPKLLDFGIARAEDSNIHTRPGDILGTPSYMSPEQVRATLPLDGRSDLFSVAVTIYEAITGEHPFRAGEPTATLARILEREVDPDPRIEPRLWLVLQRTLAKARYERPSSAAELSAALCEAVGQTASEVTASLRDDAVADGDDVSAMLSSDERSLSIAVPGSERPQPVRRTLRTTLLVGAIAALLGIGATATVLQTRPSVVPPAVATTSEPVIVVTSVAEPPAKPEPSPSNAESSASAPAVVRRAAPRVTPKRPSPEASSSGLRGVARTPGF